MVGCIRLWTGEDGNSRFEEGRIAMTPGPHNDGVTGALPVSTISFQETSPGGTFSWHTAPARQLVVTLAGTLDFQTRDGGHFILRPGDVLLAEDTTGTGHSWRLTDDRPWRRTYLVLRPGASVPFAPGA